MNADMFEEVGKRYNDQVEYNLKTMPGQKIYGKKRRLAVSASPSKSDKTKVETTTPPPPITQVFSAKSAWSDFKVTIVNYHTHYQIRGESTAPAEKWILKKEDPDKTEVAAGGLNDQYNFMGDVPGEFPTGLSLTIVVIKDGQQYPCLVELHK